MQWNKFLLYTFIVSLVVHACLFAQEEDKQTDQVRNTEKAKPMVFSDDTLRSSSSVEPDSNIEKGSSSVKPATKIVNLNRRKIVTEITKIFEKGEYLKTAQAILDAEKKLYYHKKLNRKVRGRLNYMKGISYARLNEFVLSIRAFERALQAKFKSDDIYYEYGQALYADEKFLKARLAFKKSVKKRYKIAVSLYYIAYISQQMKDYKKAVAFYDLIEKLPNEEKKDVIQASRMQVADIYLEQIKEVSDKEKSIKEYVLPQYRKALDWDHSSSMAFDIRSKIERLERQFGLVLFKMRNGRLTNRPPYILSTTYTYGMDNNVNGKNLTTLTNPENEAAAYHQLSVFGRYSLYPNNIISIAPEFSLDIQRYVSEDSSIYANNRNTYSFGGTINYEHSYFKRPATFSVNASYGATQNDSDEDKVIEPSDTSLSFTVSEELEFIKNWPSTFRYRLTNIKDANNVLNGNTTNLIWEQLVLMRYLTLFTYMSLDSTHYDTAAAQASDTSGYTARLDLIFSSLLGLFDLNLFTSLTSTNFVNQPAKGTLVLSSMGAGLSYKMTKKWYLSFNYNLDSQKADLTSDVFSKTLSTFSLNYVY